MTREYCSMKFELHNLSQACPTPINYIEYAVTDMAKAKAFYAEAFGWAFNDYGPEYAGIRRQDGSEVGGFALRPEVSSGGPLVILYSEALVASLGNVRAVGASISKIRAETSWVCGRRNNPPLSTCSSKTSHSGRSSSTGQDHTRPGFRTRAWADAHSG